jgi:Domain of unknown function (DUF4304)
MERESFLKVLANKFYPLLRGESFRGSGTTLRRIQAPVVHVVNIQGSSSADGFYVNLGAHLAFLPMEGGGTPVPAKLKEYECAFRDRIDPPPSGPPGTWPYGRSMAVAEAIVGQLAQEWERQGQPFFKRYSHFPDGFAALVRAAVASPPHPRDGLKYARIAVQLDLREEATALASQALATVSDGATSLRGTLKRFLEEQRAAQQ